MASLTNLYDVDIITDGYIEGDNLLGVTVGFIHLPAFISIFTPCPLLLRVVGSVI